MTTITITDNTLTDGSKTYDVYLRVPFQTPVSFAATSKKDAQELAEKLQAAISAHTTELDAEINDTTRGD